MRVNSRKYIQRSNPRKNKYSKKIGGQVINGTDSQSTTTTTTTPISKPTPPSTPPSTTTTPRPEQLSNVNNTLLQMLNQDVDIIAHNIKSKLGTTNREASKIAKELFDKMEELKKQIYANLPNNEDNNSYLKISNNKYGNKEIMLKGNTHLVAEGNESSERLPTNKDETINGLESIKSLDNGKEFITLEDNSNGFSNEEYMRNFIPEKASLNSDGIRRVENRLLNCQKLEYHYLKKHDEVVRLFTFILNLFDKYKYQGELLLFLLKHLVRRPISPGTHPDRPVDNSKPTIRIPRAIITNISKLIKDQDKIQEVINTMKDKINSKDPLTGTDDKYEEVNDKVASDNPSSIDTNYVES